MTISIIQHVGICQFSCWERLNTDHYRGRAARENESTQESQMGPCSIIDSTEFTVVSEGLATEDLFFIHAVKNPDPLPITTVSC